MLAEAGEGAAAWRGVALEREARDAGAGGEEESFAGAPAQQAGEERHLAAGVHGRDDGQGLDAEVLERAAAGGGLAGHGDPLEPRRRRGDGGEGDRKEQDERGAARGPHRVRL